MKKAKVNQNNCISCGACTSMCPVGAIKLGANGKAVVNVSKCIGCGKCINVCPMEAIDFDKE
jgi:ferredoxin